MGMNTRPRSAESGKILYTQVYDYIGDRIRRGDWKAHEKLPSVRTLAEELQLHRLTVFRAYGLLKEHGIVYVKEKSGYYVSEEQPHADLAGPKGEEAAFSVSPPRWSRREASRPPVRSRTIAKHLKRNPPNSGRLLVLPGAYRSESSA
ncbi:GntR family transcriptional regulator [Paenibacillus mellifer]|uniref:GntR family transcriptional regulator n=1 Tax=Paenibacillus mellifer TaxID=2937794 RepID=UPI00355665ED